MDEHVLITVEAFDSCRSMMGYRKFTSQTRLATCMTWPGEE